jgi:protein O-mannosyl-transferase
MKKIKEITKNKWDLLSLLVILGIASYVIVLNGDFLVDDLDLIVENEQIKSLGNFFSFFTSSPIGGALSDLYRPLHTLMNALIYSLFELNPAPYHFVNILFHIANSYLVYKLLKVFKFSDIARLLGALLFLLHPVQTESVAYVAGLPEPMGAFFVLSGLLVFVAGIKSKKNFWKYLLASVGIFCLALLSKEAMVIFVPLSLLLVLYLWGGLNKKAKKKSLYGLGVFAVLACLYLYLKFTYLHFGGEEIELAKESIYTESLYLRLINFIYVLWDYMVLIVFPLDLFFIKPYSGVDTLFNLQGIVSVLGLLAGLVLAGLSYRKKKIVFVGVLWFLFAMIPYSGIVPLNAIYFEHWLYISILGWIIPFIYLFDYFKKSQTKKNFLIISLAILVLFMGRTIMRNYEWANLQGFYENEIEHDAPHLWFYYDLGSIYFESGKTTEAIEVFEKAINLFPDDASLHYNLAIVSIQLGDLEAAQNSAQKILTINPEDQSAIEILNYIEVLQADL